MTSLAAQLIVGVAIFYAALAAVAGYAYACAWLCERVEAWRNRRKAL